MDLPTTIASVTVYDTRALITRHGTAEISAAGEHELRIHGLPQLLDRASLRASGRGPAGMRILGIEQEMEFHAAPPEEDLRRLREENTRLSGEVQLLTERLDLLKDQREWLGSLGEQTARSLAYGIMRGTAKPDDAGALFAYAQQEGERLAATKLDLQRQLEQAQRALDANQRELSAATRVVAPDRLIASVRLSVTSPGTVAIDLAYLIAGASWRPRYDARVDTAAGRVRLTQQALVSQQTGEDWSSVALALSTAQPSAAVRLPDDPDPWYLDVAHPLPPVPMKPAAPMMRMAMAQGAMYGAGAPTGAELHEADDVTFDAFTAELATASSERSGAAQIFRLPGGVDVPTDGAPHTLALSDYDLPARLDYVAAPVLAPGAHLRAQASNASGQVLLPGALHVFHVGAAGDEYVGATRLDLTAENADLTLYLGLDDNVTVKRELVERDTDKGSLLQSGVRRITFGYRVTLSNRTGTPQRVTLKDRLPVPRHERIKLRVLDLKPQPTTRTRLEQLSWELQLAPNEERRIEWRFVVEAPADLDLNGLP